MKKNLVSSLLALGVSSGVSHAAVLASSVAGTGTYTNSEGLLIDGIFPAHQSHWQDATNVWWNGNAPQFTFDYGDVFLIEDIILSVDNNDSYLIESSLDGSSWDPLFEIMVGDGKRF